MKHWFVGIASLCTVLLGSAAPASALECGGIDIPDAFVVDLLNSQVSGASHKISDRKTLVVNHLNSISGSNCEFRSEVDVTLKRKIRRDASGVVVLKGTLQLNGGSICIANANVADVDVSNTLNLGEAVYKWVANRVLPSNLCF